MVRGLESFRSWFHGYEKQYAIIGGTACDLLMTDAGLDFRATKDIDLVLIVEAVDVAFGKRFWEYVKTAGLSSSPESRMPFISRRMQFCFPCKSMRTFPVCQLFCLIATTTIF